MIIVKEFKFDTKSATKNFVSDTYRTVGLDSINHMLGKTVNEVSQNYEKIVRKIDKSKYPEGTKFVIAISIKSGKFAIQKALIPTKSAKADEMRKKFQLKKKNARLRKANK